MEGDAQGTRSRLTNGGPTPSANMARGALKLKREDLQAALDGDLSERHLFVLSHLHAHIGILEQNIAELDAYILGAMAPYQWAHRVLQTMLGIDQIASALILIEIGDDMTRFGAADRLAAWATLCPGIPRPFLIRHEHREGGLKMHGASCIMIP